MEANTIAASLDMRETPSQKNPSGLAWNWILEKLLELSDAKMPLLEEIMSHAPDVKEAQSNQLLEKVAVRFLEEMIVTAPLDMAAVPLTRLLTKQDNTEEASSEEICQTDLGLRVGTEAVLSTIRKVFGGGRRDWSRFVTALDQVFPEESEDTRDISQRKELVAYLFPKNQTEVSVTKLLSKYPLKVLQQDVLRLLEQKKARFEISVLDQLAGRILSKASVPSSTEKFLPTDDSPDKNRCSGHISIFNKIETHESTRQGASCQEVSIASGQYEGNVKHSRLRTAQNRKEVEKQGEEVLTKDKLTNTEKAPEEDATHKDGHVASEGEEENRKVNAVNRRRAFLNVEVANKIEEDYTSRSARTDLTYWPGRESMVVTSPGRPKVIQRSSSEIQDIPRRNLGRYIHPSVASVEKKCALVEFSNESEDGGRTNVEPCLKGDIEKRNPQVYCNSHPCAVNLFLARNVLDRGSITANSLRTHGLFRESPFVTKGASGDLDTGILLSEKNRKHENSLEHRPSKALDILSEDSESESGTPSEPRTFTPLKGFTSAVKLSSEENAQRSDVEWQSRKKSLRKSALENGFANSRLMQQTKFPSQEEPEMFFNDLRPQRRPKQGIGVQEQENLEPDKSSRSDTTRIVNHRGDALFKSRRIDYQASIMSNKFDKKSGDNETTPNVDGNTLNRLHLKDVQELEKGATQFVSNLLAFFGESYEEPKKDCNPKSAQVNLGGHEYLEIGNDGHEERCHMCHKFGELLCCIGCRIAMHTSCLEPLGLMLPHDKNWYCPVCCEREALKLVVEADKIAGEARANFEAFRQQLSKTRQQSESGTYPHKKARKEHKTVAHGSAPMKMAYKEDSTSSKLRKKTIDVQETCALRREMKAANNAMLVRKASRSDRLRAIIHQSGHSTDEDLLDHIRQDITAENIGTSSSDVPIPAVRILDVGKCVNRPVSSIARGDFNSNKDNENTSQHARGGGNPHLLEVFEPREGNLSTRVVSTRVGKSKVGHCQGFNGSEVIAERRDSPPEELPFNIPNPEGKDVGVEHVNKGGRPAPGEVEKDKEKNEGDLEEAGGKTLIGSLRNSMLGIPGVQRTPVSWTQDEEDALKEEVQRLSQNGHWVNHKTPIQMAYRADCTSSQLWRGATDVLETYVPKSAMATAVVAIVPKASKSDQWREIIHQSSSCSEGDKHQEILAENTGTSSSGVLVSVMRDFDDGKDVNRPISSIDREGTNTNKDGENPCEKRSCESNPQHTPRGRNGQPLEVSQPNDANLSISFRKLIQGHCQGDNVTIQRGDSPAGKCTFNNPNPEDEEVEVEHINKSGRPESGEVEEDKDKNDGNLEEAGGSTLIGSLRKNMFGVVQDPWRTPKGTRPWTQGEEDALKEGVQHFSQDGQRGFQWIHILQYGVGTYHQTRTSRDLSDKWRSMIKGCTY